MSSHTDTRTGTPGTVAEYATHSPYSDPGPHAALVAAVATDPASLHAAVTNAVVHYRSDQGPITPQQIADTGRRWVANILDGVVERDPAPLSEARERACQVGGCCRDHSLLTVAILREHGIPARTRAGFAGYFSPGFHHDHVVVERWDGDRWVRSDPELSPADFPFDVHDMPTGEGAPFETAAEAWLAYRAGRTDLSTYGVAPDLPALCGPWLVLQYVVTELAHRRRTELLLWDEWSDLPEGDLSAGALPDGALLAVIDRVSSLLVTADGGGADGAAAEAELTALWADDERLRPGDIITTYSPDGRIGDTDLVARTTRWREGEVSEVAVVGH